MSDIKDIDEVCLTFGKYRGLTPVEVSLIDRQYIVWMYNNVKPTPCSLELMLDCEEEIEYAEMKAYFDAENYGGRD